MTGPEHFRRAEQLAEEAHKHLGHGEGQSTAALWAAVAQVHATLALTAATALGTLGASRADEQAWADSAGTQRPQPGLSGIRDSGDGPGPL